MRWLVAAVMFSGCTLSFQPFPPPVSRQEIATAFGQRDKSLEVLTDAVNALISKEKSKAAPEK